MRFGDTWIPGLLLGLLLAGQVRAQAPPSPSEYQLKAAYLYHFTQFVDWPSDAFSNATAPLVIGVLGENPLAGELEKAVSGKSINQHPLAVKQFRSPAEAKNECQILFLSSSDKDRISGWLKELQGASVLTVGQSDGFIESGGMINFFWEGTKLRFQIDDAAAKRAGLKVSSKLLKLASPLR